MLRRVITFEGHRDRIWCVAWHPILPLLASCSTDKSIRLWDIPSSFTTTLDQPSTIEPSCTSKVQPCLPIVCSSCHACFGEDVHSRTIRSIAWSADGRRLAAASFDATISVWMISDTTNTWVCVYKIEGHENEVKSVSWHPSSTLIASSSRDKTVWIHESLKTDSQELIPEYSESEFFCAAVLDVKIVRWHPSEDIIVSGSYDDTIRIWGRVEDDWGHLQTLMGHESTVWGISFNKEGTKFASCSDDKTIFSLENYVLSSSSLGDKHSWNQQHQSATGLLTGKPIVLPPAVTGVFREALLRHLEQSPESQNTSVDGWRCESTLQGFHQRAIYYVDWHPNKNLIATGCGDNGLRIFSQRGNDLGDSNWDLVAHVKNAHTSDLNCVTWKPHAEGNGSHLIATAGDDNFIHIWQYDASDID
ncbi:WD domain, G-beta repeat-containing protein [Cardiosporidium cionae]|uniref:Probable cytosolic iron-sulfur protein assembly protein CIAO1 homolog n=1 Tax=Cardiosporidium cionae TaxID=476202 RepID=A0ABQ7JES5_9APIC|nr:WD domain, G-beta repeat-containing protein [Cardiosporidium cionae]|eukprot:KAF8822476.1 WD domain, G-beta repeat-containing protein [Cardiosporidium cionae]